MPYIGNIVQDFSVSTAMLNTDSVTSIKIDDGTIVNADINDSAAIAGTKISPDFGSQNVVTTGTLGSANLTITSANPSILFTENDQDPDFNILCNAGQFRLQNTTAGANLFTASATALNSVIHHDFGAGIDVTGAITATGDITANGGDMTISGTSAILHLVDTNDNPNYRVQNIGGTFQIYDATSDASRLNVNTDGHVDVIGNLDVGAGIDVIGASTLDGGNVTNSLEINGTGGHELYSYHDSGGVGWATGSGGTYGELLYLDENGSTVRLYSGGTERFRVSGTETVVNETGASVDFRVEGDSNTHLLFVDASADRVGINTTAPDIDGLHVTGGHGAGILSQSGGTTSGGLIRMRNTQGSTQEFYFGVGGGANNFVQGRGLLLRDETSGANRIVLLTNGNVGIGQINPSEELVVRADAPSIQLESSNASGRNYGFQSMNDGNFHVYDGTAGENRLTFDSSGNITAAKSIVGPNLTGRNIIINGDMRIAQRGTSGTFSNAGTSYPSIDRMKVGRNGVTGTFAQVGDAPAGKGFHFSAKMTTTSAVGSIAAGNAIQIGIPIERNDVVCLGYGDASAKTSVLSFYVKSSLTGSFGVGFTRNSRVQSHNITYSSADTWQFVEVVVPGDTSTAINGGMTDIGMNINITISAGTNTVASGAATTWTSFHNSLVGGGATMQHLTNNGSTFQITGVQYEIGSKASPFDHRSISEEFARCHRYFFKNINESGENGCNYAKAYSTSELFTSQRFPVRMRATPTVITFSNSGTAGQVHKLGSPDVSYTSIDRLDVYGGMRFNSSGAWATGDTDMYSYTLEASAEL